MGCFSCLKEGFKMVRCVNCSLFDRKTRECRHYYRIMKDIHETIPCRYYESRFKDNIPKSQTGLF